MISSIVDFALGNRTLVVAIAVLLLIWGAVSFHQLPVEAYPDVANNFVNVITQWPGRAAEEVEQQVSIPVETVLNGLAHLSNLRSLSLAGLSSVTVIFDDDSNDLQNRQQTLEKLSQVSLPPGLTPTLGPDFSPTGQIYFYTLTSTNPLVDLMELKALQDWVLVKQLKSIPNVADVSIFGGVTREYQVQIDPNRLISYGLSLAQVEQALTNNNNSAGGSYIEIGSQALNIRQIGLVRTSQDIADTAVKSQNGSSIRIGQIGTVLQGPKIRLGQVGKAIHRGPGKIADTPEAVEGIVLLRKGADADAALDGLHKKVTEINSQILPAGVKVIPHLDRSDLVHFTTRTVLHNLTEGILLVSIILFAFLGNARGALIVALTIPFSLLFASICLDLNHTPANLLSLGALDFGMVVDGAVVMLENIVRHLGDRNGAQLTAREKIGKAVREVRKPVFYAIAIIITAYLPIFTLQRVEGRLFRPMALTVAFALLGALLFSLIVAPVLASLLFRETVKEWHNPVLVFLTNRYRNALRWHIEHRMVIISIVLALFSGALYLDFSGLVGSEFLPHLDEGAIWARGTLAPSVGPTEGRRVMRDARIAFAQFPEVSQVVSQVGRSDDGTDPTSFFNTEYFVDLKPTAQWRTVFHEDKEELVAATNRRLSEMPGVLWNFSQPISDNVEEAVSGVKGQLAVKVYGSDLKDLEALADRIVAVMRKIPGVADLGVFRVLGQPNVSISVDRAKAARWGISVADVQDAVQTAVGGNVFSQILQGEQRFDLVARYLPVYRSTEAAISKIRLLSPIGERVSLAQLCDIREEEGASMIYREDNSRYIAIKYSVRGRDLGSTVEEAIRKVNSQVSLPKGYALNWAGEYESQKRANSRLTIIVPLTILLIGLFLYSAFKSFKWAALVIVTIVLAPIGGIFALYLTGTHFSVSSGVGFLALFGVAVQTGVIMIEYINQLRARGLTIEEAAVEGAVLRLRPITMTMLVATLGLLPAAMSHGIGSDSQRPFAIVIVGGLSATLLMSIFLLPSLYVWIARTGDVLQAPELSVGE